MAFVIATSFPLQMYVAIETKKGWKHWSLEYSTDAYFEMDREAPSTFRNVNELPGELLRDFDFQKLMATLNYVTLEFPETVQKFAEIIQQTPHFNVYKNIHQPGIIFRIPRGIQLGDLCHVFIEHEVNLSNTLRTGTLTMKVQLTFIPVHIGVFSGFEELKGSYSTTWFDEDGYGEEFFKPDYNHEGNVKKVVPLPVNMKSNLYEYLNEILFNQVTDVELINKYAVNLGCQKEKLKGKVKFIPAPENTSTGRNAQKAHAETEYFFSGVENRSIELLPEQKQLPFSS